MLGLYVYVGGSTMRVSTTECGAEIKYCTVERFVSNLIYVDRWVSPQAVFDMQLTDLNVLTPFYRVQINLFPSSYRQRALRF
jgi:hypothetical protein